MRRGEPDIVLLDLNLPDLDGRDVCRAIRQTSDVPIIMLTARGLETDRVVGLELGADDYLVKPFSMAELIARIRAVLRRTGDRAAPTPAAAATSTAIEIGDVGSPMVKILVAVALVVAANGYQWFSLNRQAQVIAAKMKSGMKFKTVIGDIAFDQKGDIAPPNYTMLVWKKDGN